MKFPSILTLFTLLLLMSCQSEQNTFLDNKVIAHRGAWKAKGLPQNSIASLQEAFDLGCMGSEFDVWMTKDGVLVLNHDADYEGMVIEEATYEEVQTLRLPNGERLPTVEEYLRKGMTQNKTKLIMEVKPTRMGDERGREIAAKVVEMVRKMGAEKWVDYITFDKNIGSELIRLDPDANVAYLTGEKTPQELKSEGYFGFDYNLRVVKENPHWIKEAQDLGLTVNVWTVNKEEDMRWLLEKQVDFITTDEPELLLTLVGNINQ
ncbi:glycerophosphodiester phosphodiesterase [Lunatimonas salinarum]|uniref:glycerophosphodiester phosphodiesterase n=1 Tax=Lunatimonas salinarum TaxID=1774590 RepID=UPI001AE09697|nr:glycerophosphodiester phosphodiesterase family protein [Lunatimonas salinarum]